MSGIRVAYADPPYLGQAAKHYGQHHDFAGEVDHEALIHQLCTEFPDGWALSCSGKSLKYLLSRCPDDVRVLAWVKKGPAILPGIRLQYAWEPVIMRGGRQGHHVTGEHTLRDWVRAEWVGWTWRQKPANHVIGMKPDAFCCWLFDCLGLQLEDELVDLFPGTGAVTDAFTRWQQQPDLFWSRLG